MAVSQEKAKEILRHGEVHGQPLTKKQKGFFGARAGGAPMPKNPPIFPVPTQAGATPVEGTPKEHESLSGPAEAHANVRGQGRFVGGTGKAFDGNDEFKANPRHSSAPLSDADFHDGGITPNTARHLNPEANS